MSRKRRSSDSSRLFDAEVCAFCNRSEDNEIVFGKFIVSKDIRVHNNCMFFSSGLSQEGDSEKDEFSGFLLPDIEAELRRGKKLFCSYCRKRGATVGCCEVRCKKTFHLNCGTEHGSLHQFFGCFSSFCKDHRPKQKPVDVIADSFCHICCEEIFPDNLDSCLYSPCCQNGWFHRLCLQKYALSAGRYFFKCPLCKDAETFFKEMEIHGINIPDKDASWELEEHAYEDLLIKPECDAATCLCLRGRKYCPLKKSGWTLMPCKYCGYHARHINCENLAVTAKTWTCDECKVFEMEILGNENKIATRSAKKEDIPKEEDIMMCGCTTGCTSNTNCHLAIKNCLKEKNDILLSDNNLDYTSDVPTGNEMKAVVKKFSKANLSENELLKIYEKNLAHVSVRLESKLYSPDEKMNSNTMKLYSPDEKMNSNSKKNLSQKSSVGNRKQTVKKMAKKRKNESACCGLNSYCIKKYFGLPCSKDQERDLNRCRI